MIKVENVNKYFEQIQALKNISFTFEAGKTNLIIGRSGSGKTVLLKSIIGLHEVDSGAIFFKDINFCKLDSAQRKEIRMEVGMLFQGSALFDSMTVEENIKFPLQMFSKMHHRDILNRVNFCLERVNLFNVNDQYPSEISGGMQKRVAIARAIALNPKYLLCDEPNSGLDPYTSQVIDKLINEITVEYNMTTIINTHDMNSALSIGENILFLNNGEQAWTGTKEEIFKTNNETLNDFVFASDVNKKIKENF